MKIIGWMRRKKASVSDFHTVNEKILLGSSVIFVEGRHEAYVLDTNGWPQRAIEDPKLEASLKGGRQAFIETGIQNIALIRLPLICCKAGSSLF